jgi:hypothetical protein
MNFGFNSNVRVGNATYHVQTEDRGPAHPFIDTVVYMGGQVIYKRSTGYDKFPAGVEPLAATQKLHERLSLQHREVIAELEDGVLPMPGKDVAPPPVENAAANDRLDLRLLNAEKWLSKGTVVLDVVLREGKSAQPIGDADIQVCLEHEKHRIPCAELRTDAKGCATLRFPMPPDVAEGYALVVRATDGVRCGELRFRLKNKPVEKAPVPASL